MKPTCLPQIRPARMAGWSRSAAPAAISTFPGRAFTLIELMIVISIVAIIVAVGVPSFVRGLRKEGLRKAVSDVVEGCSHARAQAILRGAPTELVIRADPGQITVRQGRVRNEDGGEAATPPSTPTTKTARPMPAFKADLADDIAVKLLFVNFKDQMEHFPRRTCASFRTERATSSPLSFRPPRPTSKLASTSSLAWPRRK
ncbi:MAG: prepilin-type N-terminal cleavage/methylation domain-containing protein [Verrucomicrobiota bacterium]